MQQVIFYYSGQAYNILVDKATFLCQSRDVVCGKQTWKWLIQFIKTDSHDINLLEHILKTSFEICKNNPGNEMVSFTSIDTWSLSVISRIAMMARGTPVEIFKLIDGENNSMTRNFVQC